MAEADRQHHNELQTKYFNERAELFEQQIPEDIQQRTAYIVETACIDETSIILDVGSGTGVLIDHFMRLGAKQENIVACDLSERMLQLSRARHPDAHFWRGDFMDLTLESLVSEGKISALRRFDRIFFNACFGNMLEQLKTLKHCRTLLSDRGRIVISHPLPKFVQSLHAAEPDIVPNLLPSQQQCKDWAQQLNFKLLHYESLEKLYLAILEC